MAGGGRLAGEVAVDARPREAEAEAPLPEPTLELGALVSARDTGAAMEAEQKHRLRNLARASLLIK